MPDLAVAVVMGKLVADALFYVTAITMYEFHGAASPESATRVAHGANACAAIIAISSSISGPAPPTPIAPTTRPLG